MQDIIKSFAKSILGISNDGRYGTSNARHGCIIVVSEGVKAWFTSKDPRKLKWYYHIIGHEYGHTGHVHDFNGTRKLNEYEKYINETQSDKADVGLINSGMSKEEFVEFRAAHTIEIVRLEKVKRGTLEKYNDIVNVIEGLNNEFGVRFHVTKDIFK